MRLKTQENIRKVELVALLSGSFLIATINMYPNIVEELLLFLNQNNITINELRNMLKIFEYTYGIDVVTHFNTQRFTSDYKELENLYKNIIERTGALINEFEFNDPTEIFAMYVFMYRNGYLSHNKCFENCNNMKDFAKLHGIDVIRGTGVCRSISSMLTDIYQNKGMKATNLCVKSTRETLSNLDKIGNTPLIKDDGNQVVNNFLIMLSNEEKEDAHYFTTDSEKAKKFAEYIDATSNLYQSTGAQLIINDDNKSNKYFELINFLGRYLPSIPNHLVTLVSNREKVGVYCPTNDGIMGIGEKNELFLLNNPKYSMKNFELLSKLYTLMGAFNGNIKLNERKEIFNLPNISYDEYRKTYIESLRLVKNNIDILEKFYSENKEIYDEIYEKSKKHSDMLKRMIPILPTKRK